MSDSNDNQEFLPLQKEGESETKTAEHTEVSDPNTDTIKEDTDFIENNQKSGDADGSDDVQQSSGGDDSSRQQQTSSSGGDDSAQRQTTSDDSGNRGDSGDNDGQREEGGDGDGDGEGKTEGGSKKKKSGTQENEDSIPTAGGERLGEKHWGESKIVPDVPKKEGESDGGNVSSSDGQPDKQTADNTAKNTGGSGGDDDQGNKSMIDKIKDKLPIGGHHKE